MKSLWRLLLVAGLAGTFMFPWTEYGTYHEKYTWATTGMKMRPAFIGETLPGKRIDYGATLLQAAAVLALFGTGLWVAWQNEGSGGVDGGKELG